MSVAEEDTSRNLERYDEVTHYYNNGEKNVALPKGFFPSESLDRMKALEAHDGDILLASFPKSGTHFVGEIIYLIKHGGVIADGKKLLIERCLLLECIEPLNQTNLFDVALNTPPPRLMATHQTPNILPKFLSGNQQKIVVVFRNPKDILVSFYYMIKGMKRLCLDTLTWDEYFNGIYKQGKLLFGDPFDWIEQWWKYRNDDNVILLMYENILKDHCGHVKKIAHFLGHQDIADELVNQIVEMTTFKAMKQNSSMYVDGVLREGRVGGWKEHYTAEQAAYMDALINKRLRPLGLYIDDGGI